MLYEYYCESRGEVFELEFPMGGAPRMVKHPDTGEKCSRHYGAISFVLKGGGWPSHTQRMKSEMTARNNAAGKRMRKEHSAPKLAALDYGNGDVREIG